MLAGTRTRFVQELHRPRRHRCRSAQQRQPAEGRPAGCGPLAQGIGRKTFVAAREQALQQRMLGIGRLDQHFARTLCAPRAARNFVTRTLLDWQLGRAIRFARLVISELVMSSTMNAGTDMDLSVAWNLGALRLTVRDYSPSPPRQQGAAPGMQRRGLAIISGLSRTFGVLPTADGGTVVWAVLDAPRQRLSTSPPRSKHAPALRAVPEFTDALGLDGQPFCGETGLHRGGRVARLTSEATSRQPACQHTLGVADVDH